MQHGKFKGVWCLRLLMRSPASVCCGACLQTPEPICKRWKGSQVSTEAMADCAPPRFKLPMSCCHATPIHLVRRILVPHHFYRACKPKRPTSVCAPSCQHWATAWAQPFWSSWSRTKRLFCHTRWMKYRCGTNGVRCSLFLSSCFRTSHF